MAEEMELHAKVAILLDQQGAAATKKLLRESKKAMQELEQSIDPTTRKLQKFDELQQAGAVSAADAARMRNRAVMQDIRGRLPMGLGRFAGAGGVIAGGLGIGLGLTTLFIRENLRLLRQIRDNTEVAAALSVPVEDLTRLMQLIREVGEGRAFSDAQARQIAAEVAQGAQTFFMDPEEYLRMVEAEIAKMPAGTAQERAARAATLRSLRAPPEIGRMVDFGGLAADPRGVTAEEAGALTAEQQNKVQHEVEQARRQVQIEAQKRGPIRGFSPITDTPYYGPYRVEITNDDIVNPSGN